MDERIDERVEDVLAAERETTAERLAALERDLEEIVEAARLVATDDEHDPEGSTIAFERSQTRAFIEDARKHLADLDGALERIAAGGFGICEKCGQPIAAERLLARPAARTCIKCAA
jgi:RNA polymerase-binding transcription factor DksA